MRSRAASLRLLRPRRHCSGLPGRCAGVEHEAVHPSFFDFLAQRRAHLFGHLNFASTDCWLDSLRHQQVGIVRGDTPVADHELKAVILPIPRARNFPVLAAPGSGGERGALRSIQKALRPLRFVHGPRRVAQDMPLDGVIRQRDAAEKEGGYAGERERLHDSFRRATTTQFTASLVAPP